jgi:hypothetical protein
MCLICGHRIPITWLAEYQNAYDLQAKKTNHHASSPVCHAEGRGFESHQPLFSLEIRMFWVGLTPRRAQNFLGFGVETCRCANQVLILVGAQTKVFVAPTLDVARCDRAGTAALSGDKRQASDPGLDETAAWDVHRVSGPTLAGSLRTRR